MLRRCGDIVSFHQLLRQRCLDRLFRHTAGAFDSLCIHSTCAGRVLNLAYVYQPASVYLAWQVDTERWVACDQRATECPEDPKIVGSIETLAQYLTEPFETDVEKHRVIFRWVADHISYNAKALQTVRNLCRSFR